MVNKTYIVTNKKNNALARMNALTRRGIPYRYSLSSRSIIIEYKDVREKFLQNRMDAKTFIAYSMIKRDLISKKIKIPKVQAWHIRYYQHSIRSDIRAKNAYYIDIKSAYANILYNDGFISEKSFNYIMSLPKADRLACIGMLAAKKSWYSVDSNGEVTEEGEEVSEFSGIFFYAVKRTFEIMDVCKVILGVDNAILNWVDCVYFKEYDIRAQDVVNYLDTCNLDCHFNRVRNFSAVIFKNKIRLRFYDNGKLKAFYLPISKAFTSATKIEMSAKIINNKGDAILKNYKNRFNF